MLEAFFGGLPRLFAAGGGAGWLMVAALAAAGLLLEVGFKEGPLLVGTAGADDLLPSPRYARIEVAIDFEAGAGLVGTAGAEGLPPSPRWAKTELAGLTLPRTSITVFLMSNLILQASFSRVTCCFSE